MKNYSKVDSGKRTEERQYVIPAELVLAKAGSRNPEKRIKNPAPLSGAGRGDR